MTQPSTSCLYLGRRDDPETIYLQPHENHRCHATRPATPISLSDQAMLCFGECTVCPRYLAPVAGRRAEPQVLAGYEDEDPAEVPVLDRAPAARPMAERRGVAGRLGRLSFEEWVVYSVVAALVLIIGYVGFVAPGRASEAVPTPAPEIRVKAAALLATATDTATPPPSPTPRPTREAEIAPRETAPVPTPPAGGLIAAISPSERGVGSFNDKDRLPAFGDRSLLVGTYNGDSYLGGMLFPLNRIPKDARLASAQLELNGLADDHTGTRGTWTVEMLDPEPAKAWSNLTFQTLDQAPATQAKTSWTLQAEDLAPRKINVLTLGPDAVDVLAGRLGEGRVAFRIRGPDGSEDNLFAWDSGYGEGFGTRPVLRIGFVPPAPTPGPRAGEPTALPLIVWVSEPTPAPTSTALPGAVPALLGNMILFISDRFGRSSLMVYDPAGNRFGQVTQPWVYVVGESRDARAGDSQVRVQGVPCGGGLLTPSAPRDAALPTEEPDPARRCAQIVVQTVPNGEWREITDPGFTHYDPALSPDGKWIAYVSTITGNDEIFKIRVDGSENTRLTENRWEWDKHPSWSADGTQIVFWSNRDGRKQLYLMKADGSEQRNVSNNQFNDEDPVWVK